MTIPAILNDLLDYDRLERYTVGNKAPTYIWVKKGKKEEAWAVCSLLGMIIDSAAVGSTKVNGRSIASTYIFARGDTGTTYHNNMIGVEGRFHLRDLQIYFDQWETDNAT